MGHSIFWEYQILCDTGTAEQISISAVPYFGEGFLTNHNVATEQTYLVERWRSPACITTDTGPSDESKHQIQRSQRSSVEFICC